MSRFVTLLKREWLEHRAPFFWFQAAALILLVLIAVLALVMSGFADVEIQIQSEGIQPAPSLFIDAWSEQDWLEYAGTFRSLTTAPFYGIYLIAALFMLLGTLYDERKDRSVLFWKSLPVTDLETVLSKLVMALWIAPLIVVASVLLAQICGLAILSAFVLSRELGDAWQLWWHAGLPMSGLQLLVGFFIQSLWVLPVAGYLLLISVSVPRMALLWAVALPIAPALLELVLFETRVLATGISKHIEPAALPGFGGDDRIMPIVRTLGDQLALLANPDLWIGVVIGAGFLYAAARVRGLNNEL